MIALIRYFFLIGKLTLVVSRWVFYDIVNEAWRRVVAKIENYQPRFLIYRPIAT